jgi:hypothetical protein
VHVCTASSNGDMEAGEVEVTSSSQTNTASEVNIESTPDQAQESPEGAPFCVDITKASTY